MLEQIHDGFATPLKVDREKGVIYGVKVLGWKSANKREYLPEAARRAVKSGLYENVKVYINHNHRPGEQRDARDLFGKLANAYVREDGIYAELHYNRKHPLADSIAEDAERGLGLYGLSHDAEAGEYDTSPDGIQIIKEIAAVHSVDIVADAATTSSLSEGQSMEKKRISFASFVESLTTDARLPRVVRKRLLEMDDLPPAEMDAPPADVDPMDALKDGFRAAIMAAVDRALDGDEEALRQVIDLIKSHRKIADESDATPEVDNEKSDDDDDDDDADKPKEGKKHLKINTSACLTESRAKALVRLAGVSEVAGLIEAIVGIDEDRAIKIIELARRSNRTVDAGVPRTGPGMATIEGRRNSQSALRFDGENAIAQRLAFLRG